MTDEVKMPYRATLPTTYNHPGDIVWLLPHQVQDHHEPLPYTPPVGANQTHVERLHTPPAREPHNLFDPIPLPPGEPQPGIDPSEPRDGPFVEAEVAKDGVVMPPRDEAGKFVSATDVQQTADNTEVKAEEGASTDRPVEETSTAAQGGEHHT